MVPSLHASMLDVDRRIARPGAVALFGSVTPKATTVAPDPASASLLRVTGGFSVGANVVF